jgi:mycofactocin precursor
MSITASDQPTTTTESKAKTADQIRTESSEEVVLIESDLLVEDVSIDGMCGVY